MISISFSASDNYSQHLAVVIASILVNNPESSFVFHVLHRNISNENQGKIKRLEGLYPISKIIFHFVDAAVFEAFPIPVGAEHITRETYYRYLLPDVLSKEDRTIYMDVDIICVGDLRPLWNMDLGGNIVAAVSEGKCGECKKALLGITGDAPYFNAGVMVFDLETMRRECSVETLLQNTCKYAGKIAWPDQDIINITFRNRIKEIDSVWNKFDGGKDARKKDVVVRHFANATQKPWCNIWKNTTWPIYLKYLLKSSYRDNAWRFVWGHIKGFFYFKYTKKGVVRYLVCGIRIWRHRAKQG